MVDMLSHMAFVSTKSYTRGSGCLQWQPLLNMQRLSQWFLILYRGSSYRVASLQQE